MIKMAGSSVDHPRSVPEPGISTIQRMKIACGCSSSQGVHVNSVAAPAAPSIVKSPDWRYSVYTWSMDQPWWCAHEMSKISKNDRIHSRDFFDFPKMIRPLFQNFRKITACLQVLYATPDFSPCLENPNICLLRTQHDPHTACRHSTNIVILPVSDQRIITRFQNDPRFNALTYEKTLT